MCIHCKNLTTCQQDVTMLLFHKVATRLSLTNCRIAGWQQVVGITCKKSIEFMQQSCSKLSTNHWQVVNKLWIYKQCKHILLTSCWNNIAISYLQHCPRSKACSNNVCNCLKKKHIATISVSKGYWSRV
jgi:hypothetical protein